jgi:putative flavoprotein involved in K+ transport
VVVIGSNNSAHDICAALWENDADVTMVQRSSTHIVRSETLMELGSARSTPRRRSRRHHHRQGRPDLRLDPLPVLPDFQKPIYDTIKAPRRRLLRGLEKAGFRSTSGRRRLRAVHEVPAPRLRLLHRRRRLELIADGKIKLRSGVGRWIT